jgi:hypothetical protein
MLGQYGMGVFAGTLIERFSKFAAEPIRAARAVGTCGGEESTGRKFGLRDGNTMAACWHRQVSCPDAEGRP